MCTGETLDRRWKHLILAFTAIALAFAARTFDIFYLNSPRYPGHIILSKLAGTIILVFFIGFTGVSWRETGFSREKLFWNLILGIFLSALYLALFNLLSDALSTFFKGGSFTLTFECNFDPLRRNDWLMFSMLILNMPCEEGLFRGVLQSRLARLIGWARANFIQALLFGLWHLVWPKYYTKTIFNLYAARYVAYTFVFGLLMGYIFQHTRLLTIPILIHFIGGDNAFEVKLIEIANGGRGSWILDVSVLIVMWAIYFALTIYMVKKMRGKISLDA